MNSFYTSYILSVLFSITLAASVAKTPEECKSILLKSDECVNKILLITNPDLIEFGSKQIFSKEYCEPFPAWLKCVAEYKMCLKSFQRTLFSMVVSNLKKTQTKFCKTSEAAQTAWKHARCIKPSNKETFLRIGDKLVGLTDYVSQQEDIDAVIPTLCCGARLLINRTETQVNQICKNISAPDTGSFLMEIISLVLGDVLDLVCAKHPSVDRCYTIEASVTRKLEKMQAEQGITHRRVMQSILAVLAKLDSQIVEGQGR